MKKTEVRYEILKIGYQLKYVYFINMQNEQKRQLNETPKKIFTNEKINKMQKKK